MKGQFSRGIKRTAWATFIAGGILACGTSLAHADPGSSNQADTGLTGSSTGLVSGLVHTVDQTVSDVTGSVPSAHSGQVTSTRTSQQSPAEVQTNRTSSSGHSDGATPAKQWHRVGTAAGASSQHGVIKPAAKPIGRTTASEKSNAKAVKLTTMSTWRTVTAKAAPANSTLKSSSHVRSTWTPPGVSNRANPDPGFERTFHPSGHSSSDSLKQGEVIGKLPQTGHSLLGHTPVSGVVGGVDKSTGGLLGGLPALGDVAGQAKSPAASSVAKPDKSVGAAVDRNGQTLVAAKAAASDPKSIAKSHTAHVTAKRPQRTAFLVAHPSQPKLRTRT